MNNGPQFAVSKRSVWKQVGRWTLVLMTIAFLVVYVARYWADFRSYQWTLNYRRLLLSFLFLGASFGLLPLGTKQVLQGCGYQISVRQAFWLYFVAQPSKYLPGGLWLVPGRLYLYRAMGIHLQAGGVSLLMESGAMLAAALMIGLPVWGGHLAARAGAMLGLHGTSIVFASVEQRSGLSQRIAELTDKLGPISIRDIRNSIIMTTGIYLVFWSIAAAGFVSLASAFTDVGRELYLTLAGTFGLSWAIGMLSFLTPAGLGARESAMVLLLAPFWPPPLPLVLSLASRLWWTLGDLLGLVMALVLAGTKAGVATGVDRGSRDKSVRDHSGHA